MSLFEINQFCNSKEKLYTYSKEEIHQRGIDFCVITNQVTIDLNYNDENNQILVESCIATKEGKVKVVFEIKF